MTETTLETIAFWGVWIVFYMMWHYAPDVLDMPNEDEE